MTMTEKTKTSEEEAGGTEEVQRCVIKTCPFCGSEAKEFEEEVFRITHKPGCWLVQQGYTDHLKTWISGPMAITFWETRVGD
jgi:hypothetical protein